MNNKVFITAISLILIFGFIFLAYILVNSPSQQNSVIAELKTVLPADHIKWSPDKKNVLVEYSDLQCPACKNFYFFIKEQLEATQSGEVDITKNVTFVYRHFPLFQAHKNAYAAAYAAEAAGKQNKFFEMTDLQFSTQDEWSALGNPKDFFIDLAKQLSLNEEQFKKDMDSQGVKDRVEEDINSGNTAVIRATPTFFLNGEQITNVRSFDEFINFLKEKTK